MSIPAIPNATAVILGRVNLSFKITAAKSAVHMGSVNSIAKTSASGI